MQSYFADGTTVRARPWGNVVFEAPSPDAAEYVAAAFTLAEAVKHGLAEVQFSTAPPAAAEDIHKALTTIEARK